MINRTIEPVLLDLSKKYPVVTITGPRQSGKTTLCWKVFSHLKYVNLEAPDVRRFATDDSEVFWQQTAAELFSTKYNGRPNSSLTSRP